MCCRFKLGEKSIPKDAAYQIIHDELMLDGAPRLNLASFVTTWMEPECDHLISASLNKNYVDMDEYPVTTELQVYHTVTGSPILVFSFKSLFMSFQLFRIVSVFAESMCEYDSPPVPCPRRRRRSCSWCGDCGIIRGYNAGRPCF